jgi:TolB protein
LTAGRFRSTGEDRRRITSTKPDEFEPAWSPRGTRIVFSRGSQKGDPGDIYLINLQTGKTRRLTSSPAYDHQAGWSSDGKRIVFERDFVRLNGFAIYVMNADGSNVRRLTEKRAFFFDNGPAFSPEGNKIVFGRDRPRFASDLFVMKANGDGQHRLLSDPFLAGFPDRQPLPNESSAAGRDYE